MEIYLEELDLAIPNGCGKCRPILDISTNILDLKQAMLYIPRSQGARFVLFHTQVQAPHLCHLGQNQQFGDACVWLLLLYHMLW